MNDIGRAAKEIPRRAAAEVTDGTGELAESQQRRRRIFRRRRGKIQWI